MPLSNYSTSSNVQARVVFIKFLYIKLLNIFIAPGLKNIHMASIRCIRIIDNSSISICYQYILTWLKLF